MIVIQEQRDLLKVNVYGEFTLSDYREFEQAVTRGLKTQPKVKLLLELSNMAGFTVDVAWEDIKFTRAHAHDFQRIAVVASDEWTSWASWLGTAFTDAEVQYFDEVTTAEAWLHGG
jgi:hypothetical protein